MCLWREEEEEEEKEDGREAAAVVTAAEEDRWAGAKVGQLSESPKSHHCEANRVGMKT